MQQVPVLLVHGWKSHPGIWKPLIVKLEEKNIPYWNFDYSHLHNAPVRTVVTHLQDYLKNVRERTGYTGAIDCVSHSMGAYVSRYFLEVVDCVEKKENFRQLIGIAPPNRGSCMAEIFYDKKHGPEIIKELEGIFVPRSYNPEKDQATMSLRFTSQSTQELKTAGLRRGVTYRSIVSFNRTETPEFFPYFDGKTWVRCLDGRWVQTCFGDGVIPHHDSYLPGTGFDIVPDKPKWNGIEPVQYCHIRLPKNPEVIDLVVSYLSMPDIPCKLKWPVVDP